MKILAINSSPKGKKSTTYFMVENFLKGAKEIGAETEHILLSEKKIHHCIGCFVCWTKTPGICVFDDDMKELLKKDSDILVFASPLYFDNISGLMKNFMDRCIPQALPFVEKDCNGEARHVLKKKKRPKLVVISNSGFPEQSHFIVLKTLFKRIARNMHTKVIAEIYRSEGPLLLTKDKRQEPIIEKYKMLLQKAGREISQNLTLSDQTQQDLEKPLIPYDLYLKSMNEHFNQLLS